MSPTCRKAKGQARGNSGVYLEGIHELQVLDSYGLKSQDNDCGAIYKQVKPRVNACKPPLQWQTYDVTFHKARVKDGKVEKKARVTVIQNGIKIIDDAEISPTPGGIGAINEGDDGPLLLQDHGNAVQYRNIWLKPLEGLNGGRACGRRRGALGACQHAPTASSAGQAPAASSSASSAGS